MTISKNGHRIKIIQPNLMILVSFSSAEEVLSNDVKIYHTFSSQGTENPPFRFFWTPGILFTFLFQRLESPIYHSNR